MVGLYLITFLFSIFSCKKMLGIELMYLIQLTFYSLIPKDVSCDPFKGFAMLKYSSGMTPLPFVFMQTSVPTNYSNLGIQFNFLSNVNILLIPQIIIPLLSYPIMKIG